MKTKYNLLLAVAVCFAVLAVPSFSNATPVLKLSSGLDSVEIIDGGALDANAAAGVITYIGALPIGSWTLNVTTGATNLGSPTAPMFDLNSINVSNSNQAPPENLVLMLSDTGLIGNGMSIFDSTIGGTTLGNLTYKTYYGAGLFDLANEVGSMAFSPIAFSGVDSASANPGAIYSMTQVVTISHPAGGNINTSFNGMLSSNPVPEPSSLILLGSGLLGTALFFRRKN